MQPIIKVIVFSFSSFFVLFILSKFLGKKQIAQLSFVDYVIGISIGSIAADMSIQMEQPFYYHIIAMAIFFLLDVLITIVGRKGIIAKRILKGKPIVLIYEGKLIHKNLKKSKLDINDLLMQLRCKEYFDISQIEYALFETNGQISIVPIGEERPAVVGDLPITAEKASLPNYLIVDGLLSKSGLSQICKDKQWLFNRLSIKNKRQLKQIILASYDAETDDIKVHYKE